jgi:glycosyltransferase involved in cell wall biosynthesis
MQQPSPLAGKIRLLTIGRVNANKCYEEVIRAIGLSDSLKASCSYIIAGSYESSYGTHILKLARGLGVTVQLVGEVSDTELAQLMVEADIICCLRKPVLEGGSASAIEALHSGKPVIVADAGFYRELPDEFLIKVPPIVEPSAVAAVLTTLSRDVPAAKRAAARSREWATKYFAPARYCDELVKFMDEFVAAKPLLDLGSRIGKQLAEIGLQPDDPIIGSIAAKIDELFRLET